MSIQIPTHAMTTCGRKEGLRWIFLIAVCGTLTYLSLYVAYHVRWLCLFNEMECVLLEDSNDVIPQILALRKNVSVCSDRSTKRGPHQRVISYSFYGSDKSPRKYFEGMMTNAVSVAKYYPGWVMRIYCNITLPEMVRIEEKFPFVDFCLVDDIEDHGKLGEKFGMLWRFLPMADPLVNVFVSRDLDSVITPRELAAVNEWLNSSKMFHIMRDHPNHYTEILGGMWGARVSNNITLLQELLAKMLSHGNRKNFTKDLDQFLLGKFVWQHTNGDCLLHDSYFCEKSHLRHEVWRPWPTEREHFHFVGASFPTQTLNKSCPEPCRKHKNWTFC